MLEALSQPEAWIALATLSALEIVLGIDNVVFLAILVGKLPVEQRPRMRRIGLVLALVMRIGLLFTLKKLMGFTEPLFILFGQELSGRDLILLVGGVFLIGKSAHEMHQKLEGAEHRAEGASKPAPGMATMLLQIVLIDIVFSLDSVITAVGMASDLWVMVTAMLIAVGVMLAFAGVIGDFVERHPTMKILALSFLLLIGVLLVADGFGQHISKGYIYFAMAFALGVECINLQVRSHVSSSPVSLHGPKGPTGA